jgi:hypothetical protein
MIGHTDCGSRRISDDAIKTAIETHRSSFVALQTSLSAAKLELWDYRIQRTHKAYDELALFYSTIV